MTTVINVHSANDQYILKILDRKVEIIPKNGIHKKNEVDILELKM